MGCAVLSEGYSGQGFLVGFPQNSPGASLLVSCPTHLEPERSSIASPQVVWDQISSETGLEQEGQFCPHLV